MLIAVHRQEGSSIPIYLQGLTMGLAYVAPIGAQNLFMIQTAMGNDRKRAFLTALILFCFDAPLGIACFFGAGALMTRFPLLQKLILCGGSLILLWTGLQLLRSKAQTVAEQAPMPERWSRVILTAFVVTWCNPQALIDGTLMLGAVRASLPAGQAPLFVMGTASASCLWFFGMTALLSFFRERINAAVLLWINRACGCVLMFYGAKLLWSFVHLLRG